MVPNCALSYNYTLFVFTLAIVVSKSKDFVVTSMYKSLAHRKCTVVAVHNLVVQLLPTIVNVWGSFWYRERFAWLNLHFHTYSESFSTNINASL